MEDKKRYIELWTEVLPHLERVIEEVRKFEVQGIVSIRVRADGHINFYLRDTEWSVFRRTADEKAVVKHEVTEIIN